MEQKDIPKNWYDDAICSNCGRSRPGFPVQSFGAAMKAVNLNNCWLSAEACAKWGDKPRISLDGTADFESQCRSATYAYKVRTKNGDALLSSDGKLMMLKTHSDNS